MDNDFKYQLQKVIDSPSGYWSPLNIPVTLLVCSLYYDKNYPTFFSGFMGSHKSMGWKMWLLVLACFSFDDVGTAVGFQADDQQRYEGNPVLASYLSKLTYQFKLFESETASYRFHYFSTLIVIFAFDCLKMLGPWGRFFLTMTCVTKPISGYVWWGSGANDYSILDFFMFKHSEKTPQRMGHLLQSMGSREGSGTHVDVRRRLVNDSPNQIDKIVQFLLNFVFAS